MAQQDPASGFNISAWAIRNPVPVALLWVALSFFGLLSYMGLGINDRPDVDFPLVMVSVARPGASALELETDVTKKIEDALAGIAHVEHVNSTIQEGSSVTSLQFEIGTNTVVALSDVRDAVSRIRPSLPGDITEPVIMQPTTSGLPFLTYAVRSDARSVAALSKLVDEDISRALLAVPGVSEVQRSGGLTRQIQVRLDPARLQALNTTVQNVNLQLRALNLNLPGGQAKVGAGQQGIRTLGSARSVEELRATPIILANGLSARLDTLGRVEDTYADVTQQARLDGQPVVSFSVIRTSGAPEVQTEAAARQAIDKLAKRLPADVHLELIKSMAPFTLGNFHASLDALLMGALLAVTVIYIFLRQWQATVIAGLAIPLSILPTFMVMKALDYSLNFITLLALTLVVGILVDDAIVDLENIERHLAMGKERMAAAIEATGEIGLAVVTTTLTIVAVFIPVSDMKGIMGLFFKPFGITVAVAVLFSLAVARTVTPLLAAYMLPVHVAAPPPPAYRELYLRWLGKAIDRRWLSLVLAGVVFLGSLGAIPFIGKGFFAASDDGEVQVNVSLPSGSSIEATGAVAQRITGLLVGRTGVRHVFATVGNAVSANPFTAAVGGVSSATVNVLLVPRKQRSFSAEQFANQVRPLMKAIPGARIDVTAAGGVGSAKPVNLLILGDDPVVLAKVADVVTNQMRALPQLQDVQNTAADLRPEVIVRPNFQRAAEQGVSVEAIGLAVRLATQGDSTLNLPKYNAGDQQIDILVRLDTSVQDSLEYLRSVQVQGSHGLVPLDAVADLGMGMGPVSIARVDRQRQVTFSANLAYGDLGSAMKAIYNLPAMKNLPDGVTSDTSGQAKFQADIFSAFGLALVTGVMFVYMILVLGFGSFMQPITIMMALPLSFAGAFLGLLLFGKDMGLMALIGIVMLMGLVTKNSILLVDHTIEGRKHGMTRREALLEAGRNRVRPILMTTIAMICGMLPIGLSLGEGTDRLSPMACAVMGGLVTSTLLTLMIVPATYTLVDDFQAFVLGLFRRARKPARNEPVQVELSTRP